MIRGGYTLTRERLTYDDREPDAYDWLADEVDPDEKWVARRYDTIVRAIRCGSRSEDDVRRIFAEHGIIPDMEFNWSDYLLHADMLNAATQQDEVLPLAV